MHLNRKYITDEETKMYKTYINPETLEFKELQDTEVDEFPGWVPAEVYVKNLQIVIEEALEDGETSGDKVGFAKVTWITLNKAKRFLVADYKRPHEQEGKRMFE
jgi:hypothetical protein